MPKRPDKYHITDLFINSVSVTCPLRGMKAYILHDPLKNLQVSSTPETSHLLHTKHIIHIPTPGTLEYKGYDLRMKARAHTVCNLLAPMLSTDLFTCSITYEPSSISGNLSTPYPDKKRKGNLA
jgi:hypothetical protein